MKKSLLSLLLLLSFIGAIAQWELMQGPTLQGDSYGGMSFVNDSTGYVTLFQTSGDGAHNYILRTTDYALSWDTVYTVFQEANPYYQFKDVFFINENVGWACGTFTPFILKTIDSGETWIEQTIGVEDVEDFELIKFYDENIGVAINRYSGQHAIETFDGGETWLVNDSLTGYDVSFGDACNYAVVNGGYIKETFDCVLDYQTFPTSEDGGNPERHGRAIHLLDEDTWLLGAQGLIGLSDFGSILRTDDGGNSFQILDLYFSDNASYFEFLDDNLGYVALTSGDIENAPCAIMKTFDGGITWYCQETPIGEYPEGNFFYTGFGDIECPSPEICYGSTGRRIYRTLNGGGPLGEMWTGVAEVKSELNKVSIYPNPTNGMLSISGISPNDKSTIKITDTTGRLVITEYNKQQIDVAHLPSGIYFIEVSTDESRMVLRFVKE